MYIINAHKRDGAMNVVAETASNALVKAHALEADGFSVIIYDVLGNMRSRSELHDAAALHRELDRAGSVREAAPSAATVPSRAGRDVQSAFASRPSDMAQQD